MRLSRIAALAIFMLPAASLAQSAPDVPVLHYKQVSEWPNPLKGDKGLAAGPWN